jgi:hypothetical protein
MGEARAIAPLRPGNPVTIVDGSRNELEEAGI